jgi:endonuclease-3
LIPQEQWGQAHHLLIFHGRRVCKARKPECVICSLAGLCRFYSDSKDINDGT